MKVSMILTLGVMGRLMSTIRFSTLAGQLSSARDEEASNKYAPKAKMSCIWKGRLLAQALCEIVFWEGR